MASTTASAVVPQEAGITGTIVQFPVDALTLEEVRGNITAFVEKHRSAPVLKADWNSPYWAVPARSRASSAGDGGVWFSIEPARKGGKGAVPFPEPFMSFAMAMLTAYEKQKTGGHSAGGLQGLVSSCRFLFHAIASKGYDPARLTHSDFVQAKHDADQAMGDGSRNVGSRLAFIAAQIDKHMLSFRPIQWKNRVTDSVQYNAVGPQADQRRIDRMPANDVLRALGAIAANATRAGTKFLLHDRDLICIRAVELLLCCGFRINELLTLPADPLVREPILDEFGNQQLDAMGRPATTLEVRYWPEKGGHREIRLKPVPDAARELVERAIADIMRITGPVRAIAVYQRQHRNRTLLAEPWDSLPDGAQIVLADVARIIGFGNAASTNHQLATAARQFAEGQNLPMTTLAAAGVARGTARTSVIKRDLEDALYRRSKQGNVLRKKEGRQDLSECLFIIPSRLMKKEMEAGLAGTACLLTDAQVLVFLCGQPNQPSIFERFGFFDENGHPLRVRTHAFRHWINTLANEGGLSQIMLAKLRGSTNVAQNQAYNHMPGFERAKRVRDKLTAGEAAGPLAEAIMEVNDPVERASLVATHARTMLVTDFGGCLHDWDALPCPKHGACTDCDKHWVIKGDPTSIANTRELHATTSRAVADAEAAQADEAYGATRWLVAHQRNLKRIEAILAIHADDAIPDGTLVQLKADGTYEAPSGGKKET